MRIAVICETSGAVREAFRRLGHEAWSCDLLSADDGSRFHYQGDARHFFCSPVAFAGFDLLVAHPPCTFLSSSGLHWNKRKEGRAAKTEEALAFALWLWGLPIRLKCMENPIGRLSSVMRQRGVLVQTIQPYQYGHDASKATCLMLQGLPPLRPTSFVEPRMVNGKPRWANQTDSGQNRLGPSPDRWKLRSETYNGIAQAMAEQWGGRNLEDPGERGRFVEPAEIS